MIHQRDILRLVGRKIPFKLIVQMQWSMIKALRYLMLPKIEMSYRLDKQRIINAYLDKRYAHMVPGTLTYSHVTDFEDTCPIWVLWWQGWQTELPPVVEMCRRQLVNVAGNHKIVWLDKDNVSDYVHLPQPVLESFGRGDITITHLSDIIRTGLLAAYGGLYMDATMLALENPVTAVTKTPLWGTIKLHPLTQGEISGYRWSGFCLFSYPDSSVMKFIYDGLCQYHADGHRQILDYLLIDFFMDLLYRRNEEFRHIVDTLPYSHQNLYILAESLSLPPTRMPDFQHTTMFKLNRRFIPGTEPSVYDSLSKMLENS